MDVPGFPFAHDQGFFGQVVSGVPTDLLAEESASITEGVALKRRYDLRRGRMAARQAVTQLLGPGHYPITRGDRGQPIFPLNVRGSISHCAGVAVAVVCDALRSNVLGVDLELLADRKLDIVPTIATNTERRWLSEHPEFPIAILFSAKESVYKAVAPIVGRYVGFQEVELSLDQATQIFSVRALTSFGDADTVVYSLAVRVSKSCDAVLTLACDCKP